MTALFGAALLSGCAREGFTVDGDSAMRIAVSLADIAGSDVKGIAGTAPLTELSLTSSDGNVQIPLTGIESDWTVSLPEAASKGQLINNRDYSGMPIALSTALSPFYVSAYNGSDDFFTKATNNTETVSWTGTVWSMPHTYYWRKDTELTFLAWTNLPEGSSVSSASSGLTLTHSVPATANAQKDILLGYYSGTGTEGTADISFGHPMTAVIFKKGTIAGDPGIKSIKLSGVAKSGTATMSAWNGAFSWSSLTYGGEVSQSGNPLAKAADNTLGEPFILIPQDLSSKNVTVTVTFSDDNTASAVLDGGSWQAGKTNTYILGFVNKHFVIEVEETTVAYTNTTESQSIPFTIKSYMYIGESDVQSARTAVSYTAEYYDGSEWKQFNAPTAASAIYGVYGLSATNPGAVTATKVPLTAKAKTNSEMLDEKRWSGDDVEASGWDLSKMQVGGEGYSASRNSNTANCYIVKHPGTYTFPCVYGNAIQNGNAASSSYSTTKGTLKKFLNAKGNGITSPYILSDINATRPKATLLWCDAKKNNELMIHDVELKGSGADAYISFQTAGKNNLVQGNAVIVLYDDQNNNGYQEGEALWSWHIWVTDADLGASATSKVGGKFGTFTLMPRNLGWCDATATRYSTAQSEFQIRLRQVDGDDTYWYLDVQQHYVDVYNNDGSNVFYQWGRKDPMSPGNSKWKAKGSDIQGDIYGDKVIYNASGNELNFLVENFSSGGSGFNIIIEKGIKKPRTMNNNGTTVPTYDNLWSVDLNGSGSGYYGVTPSKTVYDPSPYGYVIPNVNLFRNFTTNGNKVTSASGINGVWNEESYGWLMKNSDGVLDYNLLLPATGYRLTADGTARYYGSGCWWWTVNRPDGTNRMSCPGFWLKDTFDPLDQWPHSDACVVRPVMQ